MNTQQIIGNFTISDTDYFVRDHRLKGIHIMPGVTFLDMIFKLLSANSFDLEQVELRNVIFLEPVVTTDEFDRKIKLRITIAENFHKIEATSQKWKAEKLVDTTVTKHLMCQLFIAELENKYPVNLSQIINTSSQEIDLDDCYSVTRKVGIDHDNFMKCRGKVYGNDDSCLGEVHLSPVAKKHNQDFILHPVFLDCSTIVPLYHSLANKKEAQLYIPFYIESFSGKSLAGRDRCYIYVEERAQPELTQEMGYFSFSICDELGNRLANFRNFGIKRVHELENLHLLTTLKQPVQSQVQEIPLQEVETAQPQTVNSPVAELVELLKQIIMKYSAKKISHDLLEASFFDLGLDSTTLLEISHDLEEMLSIRLYPTLLFEHPNIKKLSNFIWEKYGHAVQEYLANKTQYVANDDSHETLSKNNPEIAANALGSTQEYQAEPLVDLLKQLTFKYTKQEISNELLEASFFELGLDSTTLLEISSDLEEMLSIRLYPTLLFENPNIKKLANFLWKKYHNDVRKYLENQIPNYLPENQVLSLKNNPKSLTTKLLKDSSINPEKNEIIFLPQWKSIELPELDLQSQNLISASNSQGKILIVGDENQHPIFLMLCKLFDAENSYIIDQPTQDWQQEDWDKIISELPTLTKVYFVVPPKRQKYNDSQEEFIPQDLSHNKAFQFIKALIKNGLTQQSIEFKIVTFNGVSIFTDESFQPYDSGLWGIWKSFSREYNHCSVTCWDFAQDDLTTAFEQNDTIWLQNILQNPKNSGDRFAVRQKNIYRQQLYNLAPFTRDNLSRFKQDATYIIIGGTGGLGLSLCRYLRSTYSSKIALIGRSPVDAKLREKITPLGNYGTEIKYFQAHCDDAQELTAALREIKQTWGKIDGIIHSAMVLEDNLLTNMSEASFSKVLSPKVTGAMVLNQVTADEELDFILFFSSLQSFVGNLGQGNYAAASTFLDGYAKYMAQQRSYPISVINWGYWGDVGAVASDKYRELMLRQGMHSIKIPEGMESLEKILALSCGQGVVVKAEQELLWQFGVSPDVILEQRLIPDSKGNIDAPIPCQDDFFAEARLPLLIFKDSMTGLLEYAALTLFKILQDLDLFSNLEQGYTLPEAIKIAKISVEHEQLMAEILNFLVKKGYLRQFDNKFYASEKGKLNNKSLANWEQETEAIIKTQPELKDFSHLLRHCFEKYPAMLQGQIAANQVIFPQSSLELVEGIYGGNMISDLYNKLVAITAIEQIKLYGNEGSQRSPQKIKLLEVGAGTGGTTREMLRLLADHHLEIEYTYTDVWFHFLEQGRQEFTKSYPGMKFSILDISLDSEAQGITEQFDIVIATNVIHATPKIRESLRHIKKLLKPMGSLILNETVKAQDFSTLTFGLLKGWWNFQDQNLRYPGSPLLLEQTWSRLLQEEGFYNLQPLVPTSTDHDDTLVQQVFVARSNGQILQGEVKSSDNPRSPIKKPIEIKVDDSNLATLSIKDRLKPVDLRKRYGCTCQEFTCIDSYLDHNESLWLFLKGEQGNALSIPMLDELLNITQTLSQKPSSFEHPKMIYISHYGNYFSLGGDRSLILDYLDHQNQTTLKNYASKVTQVIQGVVALEAIVVAVVNGAAQGGGLEMLMCTDFQFMASEVKLGLPESKSGLIPGMGGMSFFKEQIGALRTKQLVLSGGLIEAQEAQEIGLISHVATDPFKEALRFHQTIDNFATAIYLKKYLDHGKASSLTQDIETWVEYLVNHHQWVNQRRIAHSLAMIP